MDYTAVVRDYHESGTKLSLSDWCRKEGSDYSKVKKYNQQKYTPVNDKQLITVLNAKIAQLTVELQEAERNGSSAQLLQFEQLLSRQKEEDRAYYEHKMEEARAYYEQRMEEEHQRHEQKLNEERERHHQEVESLKTDFRFQLGCLHERLDVLQKIASAQSSQPRGRSREGKG